MSLTETLKLCPDKTFWEEHKPAYNRIFGWVVRNSYRDEKMALPTGDTLLKHLEQGSILNLSSFQRSVAKEAARRRAK